MITFGANLIQTTRIQKYAGKQGFQDCNAYIVKLDTGSKLDFKALTEVDRIWDNGKTFAGDIRATFRRQHLCEDENSIDQFFALTRQRKDFQELKSEDILGLAQLQRDNEKVFLDYLQADPDNNFLADYPMFKRVGTAMVNFIKEYFPEQNILLNPTESVIPFYEKLGFILSAAGRYMSFKR